MNRHKPTTTTLARHRQSRTVAIAASASILSGLMFSCLGSATAWADGPASQTYTYTGAAQSFTVPAHIGHLHITATGAAGGDGFFPPSGGLGDTVSTDLPVGSTGPIHTGDQLVVQVGGIGSHQYYYGLGGGGYNGGGNAYTYGGSGGGASDVRLAAGTLQDRIVVAGGGGGGGFDTNGGSAGTAGAGYGGGEGGGGGGTTEGGRGGSWNQGESGVPATDGAFGQGGDAAYCSGPGAIDDSGGAGGGGWYGGGGGDDTSDCSGFGGSGGGGGSDYTVPAATNVTTAPATGPAQVTISWTVDSVPPVITAHAEVTATAASGATSSAVTYTAPTATDALDGAVPVTCTPASGSTFAVGATLVTCTATDSSANTATSTFNVKVTAAVPPVNKADLKIAVTGPATAKKGSSVIYTLTVTNTGPAAATKVDAVLGATGLTVTKTVPAAASGSASIGSTTVSGSRWSLPSLASGTTSTFTVTGTVTAATGKTIALIAGVTSTLPDPAPANNLTTLTTKVS